MSPRSRKERDLLHEAHAGAEPAPEQGVQYTGQALSVVPGAESPGDIAPHARGRRAVKPDLRVSDYTDGILAGDRVILGRAITLVESMRPEHNRLALELLERVLPHTGRSLRIGITGVPGVGKSTFIETLGTHVTGRGHLLAVLAIDPSSRISKGSIMGDKTRMEALAVNPRAFIRPSPSAGSLGGVARKTREALLLCEAAGFDVVFVETVGVGQSETVVHSMVDAFLLLMLGTAGDSLQGIKRGIMELADMLVINKADGELRAAADRARQEYEMALHLLRPPNPDWFPPVRTCSSITGEGIADVWEMLLRYRDAMTANGRIESRRKEQMKDWMRDTIRDTLWERFTSHAEVAHRLSILEASVADGAVPALLAAQELLTRFFGREREE